LTVDPQLENLRRNGKLFACKGRIMDTLPQLSPEQTAALDVLVDLFRQSLKGNSEARSTFLGIAIYLAQTNVLDYLVAALLKQAQVLNIPPTKSLLFREMAFEIETELREQNEEKR
jgi:hypothetical protein